MLVQVVRESHPSVVDFASTWQHSRTLLSLCSVSSPLIGFGIYQIGSLWCKIHLAVRTAGIEYTRVLEYRQSTLAVLTSSLQVVVDKIDDIPYCTVLSGHSCDVDVDVGVKNTYIQRLEYAGHPRIGNACTSAAAESSE